MFDIFFLGFTQIFQIDLLTYLFLGTLAGIMAGAIPGLTVTMAIVLALPFTFVLLPAPGLITMLGVYVGGLAGGLISAALLGISGTPSAVATTFDAYPMARQGEAGRALGIGIWASFFGSLVSLMFLIMLAPRLAELALLMGPWEHFSLLIFALTLIAIVTSVSVVKGLLSASLGLLLAAIGLDPLGGLTRLTFGVSFLDLGVPFFVVLVGLFAVARLLFNLENIRDIQAEPELVISQFTYHPLASLKEVLAQPFNLLRSSLLGVLIGLVPGAGAGISNCLTYTQAKNYSRKPGLFGTGIPAGIIAAEAGNNSTAGGSLVPMLALGIPGSAVGMVIRVALKLYGLNPGPTLIRDNPEIIGMLFAGFFAATIFMLIIKFFGARLLIKIPQLPKYIMVPSVLAYSVIGTYLLSSRYSDLYILFALGVIGYFLRKYEFPLSAVVMGAVIGSAVEINLRQALLANSNWTLFLTRPVSLIFLVLAVLAVIVFSRQRWDIKHIGEC